MSDQGTTREQAGETTGRTSSREPLGVVSRRIIAVLLGLVRSIRLGIGSASFVLFLFGVLVLLSVDLLDPVTEWIRSARDQDSFGKVIVESPEVYTRERLVNDRLAQTVWLKRQMIATRDVLKEGNFRSHEAQWTQTATAMTSADLTRTGRVGHTGDGNAANLVRGEGMRSSVERRNRADGPESNRHETGTSLELFRAMNEYREQVRMELMQTQLDDRHDIDGNTLYRLNFNTTVVHGRRSDALAVIRVKLTHGETIHDVGKDLYRDLLHAWAKELERRLNDAADNRVRDLLYSPIHSGDAVAPEFYQWIRWKLCNEITYIVRSLSGPDWSDVNPSPATIGELRQSFRGVETKDCGGRYYHRFDRGSGDDRAEERLAALKETLDRFIGNYVGRFRNATDHQKTFLAYANVRRDLVANFIEQRNGGPKAEGGRRFGGIPDNPLDYFRELGRKWCRIIVLQQNGEVSSSTNDMEAKKKRNERELHEQELIRPLCTAGQPEPARRMALNAVMDLYWRLEHLKVQADVSATAEELTPKRRVEEFGCTRTTREQMASILGKERDKDTSNSEPQLMEPAWIEREREEVMELLNGTDGLVCMISRKPFSWIHNLVVQQEIDTFNRKFIEPEVAKSGGSGELADIITVEPAGCEAELCRVSVELVMTKDGEKNDPVTRFFNILNKDHEAFSYGVTPKNWRQRIAFSDAIVRNLAVALEIPTLDGGEVKGLFEKVRNQEELMRSAINHPIVIGFGRGSIASLDCNSEQGLPAECEPGEGGTSNEQAAKNGSRTKSTEAGRDLSRGTEFGWIVAPERSWGDGGRKWHPHRQYDLSAVVSIPSWWTGVTLTVSSCWWKLRDLENLDAKNIDKCGSEGIDAGTGQGQDSYSIKLPGDVKEVSRKLRIEVREVPYILHSLYNPQLGQYVFHVGMRADMVIEGGRLWRSTIVTLGTQPADEITVLPHMEGIVATFYCVRRPPFSPMPKGLADAVHPYGLLVYATPVQVWTSEGVTFPPLVANIVEADRRDAERCPKEPPRLRPDNGDPSKTIAADPPRVGKPSPSSSEVNHQQLVVDEAKREPSGT